MSPPGLHWGSGGPRRALAPRSPPQTQRQDRQEHGHATCPEPQQPASWHCPAQEDLSDLQPPAGPKYRSKDRKGFLRDCFLDL